MHPALIWIAAVLLLAAGYPLLHESFGDGWKYFFVVAVVLLITRHIAKKYGRRK